MGTLQILGLKCTYQDRTCLLTSEFRQQFGSNIGQNLGLKVSIMIEHRAHFRAKSVRIVIEHIKAYADLLCQVISAVTNRLPFGLESRGVEDQELYSNAAFTQFAVQCPFFREPSLSRR
jgi:hypothetical protein